MTSPMLFSTITLGLPDGTQLPKGHRVPEGVFSEEKIERLLSKGYIKEFSPDAPVEEKPAEPDGSATPTWNFDPKELEGKSLEALNMMIIDRAEKMRFEDPPAFDDLSAALAFMSSEFEVK